MKNKSQKYLENTISKRFFLLSILKGAVVGGIGWRFFDLQMIENRKYEKLSDNNQFNFHMIAPERGRILDRKMRLLAGNMDGFSLVLNWNKNVNEDEVIKKILKIINISQKDLNNFYEEIKSNNKEFAKEILITKNLSQKDVSKLAVRSIEFPEVSFSMTKKRVYPQGIIAGHITGYIGPYSEKDTKIKIKPNTSWLEVGKTGLEKFFEKDLRGKFGRKRNEVTSKGHIIASQIYENTISGNDIQTSLDMGLQAFAIERFERGNNTLVYLKNDKIKKQIEKTKNINYENKDFVYKDKKNRIVNPQSGSLVVMDIENGEILCSVSSPGYDPNIFSEDLDINVWNSLKNNSRAPLLNRSMSGVYPPGSTIKMAVALAALENGIIDYNTKFYCDGAKRIRF